MSLNILQASERSYKSLIKNPSSPFRSRSVGAEGGWGEGEGRPHPQPLSRPAGEG